MVAEGLPSVRDERVAGEGTSQQPLLSRWLWLAPIDGWTMYVICPYCVAVLKACDLHCCQSASVHAWNLHAFDSPFLPFVEAQIV